ncbi:DUF5431 family protein [Shimwellia blattae]|uniref:DUF5431 family protein n=1 Tax=Shimwellia blattae TaxID=563 RepID=UPI00278C3BCD|nr:DUF5431 family protein [Shimwellia blattae]
MNPRGLLYAKQHQSSRLSAARQGDTGHEIIAIFRSVVSVDSVFNAVTAHLNYPPAVM